MLYNNTKMDCSLCDCANSIRNFIYTNMLQVLHLYGSPTGAHTYTYRKPSSPITRLSTGPTAFLTVSPTCTAWIVLTPGEPVPILTI